MNEIEQHNPQPLTWDGKRIKSSDEQIVAILQPVFETYPNFKVTDAMLDMYVRQLQYIDPVDLAQAVMKAVRVSEFAPTIATIIKCHEESKQAPGPRSEVDLSDRRPLPMKMFRLPDDEDRAQRLERLKQTKNWDRNYG